MFCVYEDIGLAPVWKFPEFWMLKLQVEDCVVCGVVDCGVVSGVVCGVVCGVHSVKKRLKNRKKSKMGSECPIP